ncbi:phosphatase PAP2 family protein [Flavitalea sp. BT771]|uniref:phosphatase PAP2 family protein n=1 Tax=Flavitalea sp. BT771 TaxID=3063329 RepID=UPI0026E17D36|nr:phosphatase PAP2 family protein [Flavitalea sp. BT771]MDO6434040.1 phosphatase PAP2 family protein [Flavitalea sp. BT771]MDV6222940.1 phosphatase PAP2 family protein [Flavitalea sp. BT771]
MNFPEWLDHIDKILFTLIQHDSDHAVLDRVAPILRDPYTWIPFYVFMLYYSLRYVRQQALPFILLSLLTFAITDSLTAQVMKPFFERLRPCHDPDMAQTIRILGDCGGLYSMPSSHAANHFGLAAFWYFAVRTIERTGGSLSEGQSLDLSGRRGKFFRKPVFRTLTGGKKWWGLYVWAAAVCYAQIYVGKHYPFDTLAGAGTGWLTGVGISRIFNYVWARNSEGRYNFIGWFKKEAGNTN